MQTEKTTLAQMAVAIFKFNAIKGFWDEPRSVSHCADLVASELGEMLEAERKGRVYKSEAIGVLQTNQFEDKLKDTLQDELADTVIRMLDVLGFVIHHSDEGELCEESLEDYYTTSPFTNSRTEARLMALKKIASFGIECKLVLTVGEKVRTHTFAPLWRLAMLSIIEVARTYQISSNELLWFIDQKVEFNKTRAYKHGKQF